MMRCRLNPSNTLNNSIQASSCPTMTEKTRIQLKMPALNVTATHGPTRKTIVIEAPTTSSSNDLIQVGYGSTEDDDDDSGMVVQDSIAETIETPW